MRFNVIQLAVFGLLMLVPYLNFAQESHTYKDGNRIVTEGRVDASDWYDRGLRAIGRFQDWDKWALKWIDGKDPESAKYWEHLVHWEYQSPDTMTLIYDLNMAWPLGSKGNKIKFQIDDHELENGFLKFTMLETPFVFKSAEMTLSLDQAIKNTRVKWVSFKIAIEYNPAIERLLSMDSYGQHLNRLAFRLASNLKYYARSLSD